MKQKRFIDPISLLCKEHQRIDKRIDKIVSLIESGKSVEKYKKEYAKLMSLSAKYSMARRIMR